jgi:crotonobetainyl-CoA:carnitine CoA-transferase CaiB-like acyl-CoA transferase
VTSTGSVPQDEQQRALAPRLPLTGIRVLDVATLGAGPWLATRLADFGADVIKVEHPDGDPLRLLGEFDGDVPLWWKVDSRNKRCMTLDLGSPAGQQIVRELVRNVDFLVENFRPGTLERWNLGYEDLRCENPGLIMIRVTGWGQDGPYADRPGFGTLAEAFSGWAHLNGFPDGPPTLPPMALGDAVASILGAFAALVALRERDMNETGEGQVVDLAIYESLFSLIGMQVVLNDRLGVVPQRTGNSIPFVAPRNVYVTSDGSYVALAASTPTIFERVARAIDRPDLATDPRFADNQSRVANRDELDRIVGGWIETRTLADVLETFERHEAAVAPVYDIGKIMDDRHYRARGAIVTVDDPELGPTQTADVFPRLSRTPGSVRHLGPASGSSSDVILTELGYSLSEVESLREAGVI